VKTPEIKTVSKNIIRASVGGPLESAMSSSFRNRPIDSYKN